MVVLIGGNLKILAESTKTLSLSPSYNFFSGWDSSKYLHHDDIDMESSMNLQDPKGQ